MMYMYLQKDPGSPQNVMDPQNWAATSCYLEHGALAALAGLCYDPQVPGPLHVRLDLLGGPTRGVGQRFHQHTVPNTQLHSFPGRGQPESWFILNQATTTFRFKLKGMLKYGIEYCDSAIRNKVYNGCEFFHPGSRVVSESRIRIHIKEL